MSTALVRLSPYLLTGEKTGGIPGIIILIAVVIIAYLLFKKRKKTIRVSTWKN